MPFELPLPPAAQADKRSLEMIRVWLAKGQQHCVLNIGFWEDRGMDERWAWGVLLADMIHHISDAHHEQFGRDQVETIRRIREAFEAEMERATSARRGEFVVNKASDRDSDT